MGKRTAKYTNITIRFKTPIAFMMMTMMGIIHELLILKGFRMLNGNTRMSAYDGVYEASIEVD